MGFGLNSVPVQPAHALQPQLPQMLSSTQPQHPVDLHATYTYVDEFDYEDAVSETDGLPASRPHCTDSSDSAHLVAQPTATTPIPSQTEQFGELGGAQRLEFAPPVPAQSPPARPAQSPAAGVGSTLTKEDLIDFADQMKSVR